MKITVLGPKLDQRIVEYPKNTRVETILNDYRDEMPYPIYACKLDNAYRALTHVITHDCEIEFLDLRNQATWLIYQNSLVILFIKAIHDLYGKDITVSVRNSLNKGLYVTTSREMTEEMIPDIEVHMRELVEQDIPIRKEWDSRKNAMKIAKETKQKETYKILKSQKSLGDLAIYSLADEKQIFYSGLKKFKRGLIIRFPHQ